MSENYNISFDVVSDDLAELGSLQAEACCFAALIANRYPEMFVKYLGNIDLIDLRTAIDKKLEERRALNAT